MRYGLGIWIAAVVLPTPAGPNIINFAKIVSLDEMLGHIYGRCNVMERQDRPHMFLRELELYIEEFHKQIAEDAPRLAKYENNLCTGIEYYRDLAVRELGDEAAGFLVRLDALQATVPSLEESTSPATTTGVTA